VSVGVGAGALGRRGVACVWVIGGDGEKGSQVVWGGLGVVEGALAVSG